MVQRQTLTKAFFLAVLAASPLCFAGTASARSVIKQPGLHPRYDLELEPHLAVSFSSGYRYVDDDGFGPGLRLSIPIVPSGPISTINNSMAIGFGLDWTHHDGNCRFDDCDADALWFPVVLQWNFWLTDMISVFGEPGLGIRHVSWDDAYCDDRGDCDDTDFKMMFFGGGRFMFSDTVGGVVRLGWPYLSLGVTFLL